MNTSLAVIIPAFNEELGIQDCIHEVLLVLKKIPKSSLIIIDDGSTDKTKNIIQNNQKEYKNLILVSYSKNKGYGGALRTGIKYAYNYGFTYGLVMDSDLTNNPKLIPRFLEEIELGYDCVKGSRYIKGGNAKNVPFRRRAISVIGDTIASVCFNIGIKDCTNGFRILRLEFVKDIPYKESGFSHILEEVHFMKKKNAKFKEIPIILTTRKKGSSNFRYTPQTFGSYLKYPILSLIDPLLNIRFQMNLQLYSFKGFVFHPVRSRVLFDFLLPFTISILTSFIIYLSTGKPAEILSVILLPFFLVTYNYTLGLYSTYRLAEMKEKISVIIFSSILTFFSLFLIFGYTISLALSIIFSSVIVIMPRIFLNYNKIRPLPTTLEVEEKKYVLVTGGGGFIGTVLVEKLLIKGYKVKVLDKFIYGKDVFKPFDNLQNLELIQGDITNPYVLTQTLRNVESVIHLAGIVGEPAAAIDEALTRHINIVSTRMLKEMVKAFNISRFIFASTTAVYGPSSKISNENSPVNPASIYTKTKVDSEEELLHDTHDNFHPTILRISTAFGHSYKPKFDLVANLFVAQALTNKKITVINGYQWRSFIHVSDIAEAFIKTLEADIPKVSRQVFNVGESTNVMKLTDLANLTVETLKMKNNVVIVRKENEEAANYRISFDKIKKVLNYKPEHTLVDGILEIQENLIKHTYKKNYTDPYYSSYEAAREVLKEFYSEEYRKHHYSTLS